MQLNSLTFNQHRLKRLNTQPVQRGGAVKQYRMLADNLGEDIPHFWRLALYHLLGGLDRRGQATKLELAKDEGLE